MALKNRDNNVNYVRLKDGKFYVGKDLETPFDEMEGRIVAMRYKDEEYEGTPQRKLIVVMNDAGVNYQLGLNVESANYNSLISFLMGVDINRTLTLHPKMDNVTTKEGKEVKRYSILVSQDGKYAKSYFNKDNKHGLPEWKKVTVGKKTVIDKSESLEFLEKFVNDNFISKLDATDVAVATGKPSAEAEPVVAGSGEVFKATDLPWDE